MPEHAALPPIASEPVSLLLLADNDGAHLDAVIGEWAAFCDGLGRDYEIILVDDGSTDQTAKLLTPLKDRHGRLKVVSHPTRLGEGAALKSGLAVARYPLLSYTVCDPAYRPADFPRLLAEIDKVHLICGFRAGRPVPLAPRLFGAILSFLSRVALGTPVTPLPGWLGWKRHLGRWLVRVFFGVRNQDVACPFRLIRRDIFALMPVQSKGTFAHAEILAKANFLGCLVAEEVPLGDAARPCWPCRRGDPTGRVLKEGLRLLVNPKFAPPPAAPAKPDAEKTNLDDPAARRL